MALTGSTNYRRQEQVARQNGGQTYDGLRGVSPTTAQKLGNYQTGYQPGLQAQAAKDTLQQVQAQKPQGYNSKYGEQLDSIMAQIANPKEFKYEFNGDELFKYYADLYTQKGRQASMDAMGQAAALTGGYGNSYAQQVGQQGYEQYLLDLYNRGMDLQNAAYARYQDAQRLPYQQLEALQAMDKSDYARYRDTVGDWERELARAEDAERYEREFEYADWQKQQDYYTKLAQVENADYQTEQDRQEAIRQFQLKYDRGVLESDRAYDRNVLESDRAYNRNVLENDRDYNRGVLESDRAYNRNVLEKDRDYNRGVLESDRAYNRGVLESDRTYNRNVLESDRTFQEKVRQANLDEAYRRDTLAEQIRQADMDEAYRRSTLAEQIRQADMDEAYRNRNLDWSISKDQRDYERGIMEADRDYNRGVFESDRTFDETRRLNDQKVAANYAMAILENGQMPSLEMLTAAGISEEDARKLLAQAQQIGAYGGGGGAPAAAEEAPRTGVNVVTRTPNTSSTSSGGTVNITPTAPTTRQTTTPVVSTPERTATFADLSRHVQQKLQDALDKSKNKG